MGFLGRGDCIQGGRLCDGFSFCSEKGDEFRILVNGSLSTVYTLLGDGDTLVRSKLERGGEVLEVGVLVAALGIMKDDVEKL